MLLTYQKYWKLTVLFLGAVVASYAAALINWDQTIKLDWNHFNSLSLFMRSSILQYGRLPFHDPWSYGGQDLLINSQNRIFTPSLLLDLALPPHHASLVSMMLYAFGGLWGMYLCLQRLGVHRATAAMGAILYLNSNCISLRLAEGSIVFESFYLLPWVFALALRWERKIELFALLSLLTLFLLDGGIYTFVISILFLGALAAAGLINPFKILGGEEKSSWRWLLWCLTCAALLAGVKVIPQFYFQITQGPPPAPVIPWRALGTIFFRAAQDSFSWPPFASPYRFHEYGCYLGEAGAFVTLWALMSRAFFKDNVRLLGLLLFWLWLATGWGYPWHPWWIFQHLPLLKNMHLPIRLMIVFYLIYVVLLSRSLERLKKYPILFLVVGGFLLMESFSVRNFPWFRAYRVAPRPAPRPALITNSTIRETAAECNPPDHYFVRDLACLRGYDPTTPLTHVRPKGHPDYRGEVYVVRGQGQAALTHFVPGEFHISYQAQGPMEFHVNSNYLGGWKSLTPDVVVFPTPEGLIGVRVMKEGKGEMTAAYRPIFLGWALASFIAGAALWTCLAAFLLFRRATGTLARPEAQPQQ